MKKIIIYIVIIGLIACKETDSNFVSLIVLSDKTDEHIPRPELADIQYFFHQSDFINAGKRFYFREITHTSVNKLYTAEYFQSSLLDNKLSEKKDKTDFEARIENILRKNHNEKQKYENSTIIKPLIQCLELLKAERSTRKIIILYSDLLEANELFNTYNFKNSNVSNSKTKRNRIISCLSAERDL